MKFQLFAHTSIDPTARKSLIEREIEKIPIFQIEISLRTLRLSCDNLKASIHTRLMIQSN